MSCGRADDALVVELIDALRAEPLDVEGVARDEMLEALARLRRADQPAGAAPHRILLARARIDLAHGVAAAGRAHGREDVGLGARRALVERHLEHLRDDVAGALHHDRVADADVDAAADRLAVAADALDVVLVVQRRVRDHDAADGHRAELRDRVQRAGAADLDLDVLQDRRRLLGRELVGERPARRARDEAEALLQVEVVDLVDDAVDVVAETRRARPRSRDGRRASRRGSRRGASAG